MTVDLKEVAERFNTKVSTRWIQVQFTAEEARAIATILRNQHWVDMTINDWEITCSACPLQLEGRDAATQRPVYFRERWGSWYLEYSDDETNIVDGTQGDTSLSPAEQVQERLAPYGIQLGTPRAWE